MNPFKHCILASVVAFVSLGVLAPSLAAAESGTATPKKCHWDKKTGRMVCQRPPR